MGGCGCDEGACGAGAQTVDGLFGVLRSEGDALAGFALE